MPLKIIRNDITKVPADVIVNFANPKPKYGTGTDYAIYLAAGADELLEERRRIGNISVGDIAVTPAFNLPAKYIIHTVGPIWFGGNRGELKFLESCYRKSLEKAVELECESIAFPLISTGVYMFPRDKALHVAMSTISEFLFENDLAVYIVVFDEKSFQLSGKVFADVDNYIDEKQFGERLLELIDEKGMKDPDVYKRANIDRKLFSKIRCTPDYKPRKRTAVALALALELGYDEIVDLLGRAGLAFSPSSRADRIVEYFVKNGIYDVQTINLSLFEHGEETLGD